METKSELILKSKEGQTVKVSDEIAMLSTFIQNQVEENEEEIYLPNIGIRELKLVVKYAKMHNYKPPKVVKPIKSS